MSHWESSVGKSDEYYTPIEVVSALGCRFDMDVAAPVDRTFCCIPAKKFITENSLSVQWEGFIWMNPPFGGRNGLEPWLKKIATHGNGIALTPDRSSTTWWQNAARSADLMLAVHGKIKFVRPDGTRAKQPSTGTTLFAFGEMAKRALRNAEGNKLGIVIKWW